MESPLSRLRQERLARGWSLTLVTTKTEINTSSLSLVERGKIPAYPDWQRRIASAFEMPIEELFEDRTVKPAHEDAA